MNKQIENYFSTPIGNIICSLKSNSIINSISNSNDDNKKSEIFMTNGYKIEVIEFKIKDNILNSIGWIFKIKKNNND